MVSVTIHYEGYESSEYEDFNNTQDAQSFLQTKKCYNKEKRHR